MDPLFVYYWSSYQLVIYKDELNNYCRLAIDATGGLIKKLEYGYTFKILNIIFLYEGVISAEYVQIPIVQMVSESHDTDCIYN